ncbi:MAG TPA: dihydrodipicolinate synthase family protein [Ilumatobacteraceae bacterium]|nr:dihydrodipicolinate synthase family protein [Ilumatobacteraceae bacterium]
MAITPFGDGGVFDESLIRSHLRRIAAAGVGVYVGGGGSGEGYTLDLHETQRLVEITVDELRGKVPVRAMGKEPRLAAEMVDYVRMATAAGVDACQIYSLDQGHGHRPTMPELERYFVEILDNVSVPTVLSTHQSVGYQVPVDMLERLVARFPDVVGINSSHQDIGYLRRIIDALGSEVSVHVGGPLHGLTNLSLGGHGFVCSEANLAPVTCQKVIDAFIGGDATMMTEAFGTVVRLFEALYGAGGIRATKALLSRLGLAGGPPRLPQLPVESAVVDRLLALVHRLGIAETEGFPLPV